MPVKARRSWPSQRRWPSSPVAARPGSGGTSAAKPGSRKNGNDSRGRPLRLRTRCGVDRYQPPVSRSSMSPMLQTNVPGTGGAVDPALRRGDLQAAAVVLRRAASAARSRCARRPPSRRPRRRRRVAEDPEQDGRIRGVPVREVRRRRGRGSAPPRPAPTGRGWSARPGTTAPSSRSRGTWRGNRLRPCSGRPASTRGSSAGSSAPKYRPSFRSGCPEVSSSPTGK